MPWSLLIRCASGFSPCRPCRCGPRDHCCPCGYIYDEAAGDPDNGIAPGTKWEDLPEDWVCPVCGLGKDVFKEA